MHRGDPKLIEIVSNWVKLRVLQVNSEQLQSVTFNESVTCITITCNASTYVDCTVWQCDAGQVGGARSTSGEVTDG
jgi:hypothetical protein